MSARYTSVFQAFVEKSISNAGLELIGLWRATERASVCKWNFGVFAGADCGKQDAYVRYDAVKIIH